MNNVALPEQQLRELALFAGAGGGILGGHLLGWRTVCAVEFAAYPRSVLLARQRDGMLPAFPCWDDVRTFDGKPWRGHVDVISGGFPCQDISIAGKGDGLDGERSGLWSEMARIISEVQPRFAFVENSPMLTSRGLGRVLGDLSQMGYSAEWGVVGADDAGAPHRRERIWILAYTNSIPVQFVADGRSYSATNSKSDTGTRNIDGGCGKEDGQHPIGQLANTDMLRCLHGQAQERSTKGGVHAQREPEPSGEDVADAVFKGPQRSGEGWEADNIQREGTELRGATTERGGWWSVEPGLGGMVDELADRLDLHGTPEPGSVPRVAAGIHKRADRLKAIGNGQVPAAAHLAWTTLYERIQRRLS